MRIEELRNVTLGLKRMPGSDGVKPHWELSFTDRMTGDIVWVALTMEVGAEVATKLNGGVEVVKPKLVVPGA